jgi:hypothetical protein
MWKLKNKSILAKFFKWVWNKEPSDYKSMCLYFWQYVMTIIFLPVILAAKICIFLLSLLPAKNKRKQAVNWVANSKVGDACGATADYLFTVNKFWRGVEVTLKFTFFLVVALIIVAVLCKLVAVFINDPWFCFAILGMICLGIAIVIGIVALFTTTNIGKILWSPFRLFGTMVSSFYNNWCPRIEWVD